MFDKIAVIHAPMTSHNNDRAIREMSKAIGEKLDDIIQSRDRVDISLEEYTRLNNRVRECDERLRKMGDLIIRMGIPAEIIESIIPDSVRVYHTDDIREFKRKYQVTFDVYDDPDFRKWKHEY